MSDARAVNINELLTSAGLTGEQVKIVRRALTEHDIELVDGAYLTGLRRHDSLLREVGDEIARQDEQHPSGYPATRDGVRHGITTVGDELHEAYDAWREERCRCKTPMCGHATWGKTRTELMQAAAVALRAARSITGNAGG